MTKQELLDDIKIWLGYPSDVKVTLAECCEMVKECGSIIRNDFCNMYAVPMAKLIDEQQHEN
jgi:hypothetical protein